MIEDAEVGHARIEALEQRIIDLNKRLSLLPKSYTINIPAPTQAPALVQFLSSQTEA
jgi:hypothetical protein